MSGPFRHAWVMRKACEIASLEYELICESSSLTNMRYHRG